MRQRQHRRIARSARNGHSIPRPTNCISRAIHHKRYSVSYLPSSGDQFSSLTAITEQVKPERFNNYELGLNWDLQPALALTTAVYRLDRTNTRSTDPNDPTRIVQTGSQRTNGYELGVNGSVTNEWAIAGGYAYQDAFVTSATTAARAGAQVGQVPHHTLSLWNNYRFHPRLSADVGLIYRCAWSAKNRPLRLPACINKLYYVNADNNTNISPG